MGGAIKGCPTGLCVVGLHAPDGAITSGRAEIEKVCGKEVARKCTIAAGDFTNEVSARWKQLIGTTAQGQAQKITVHGSATARVVSNIVGQMGAMTVGQGFPLAKQFGNVTGQGQACLTDLLLPCAKTDQGNKHCAQASARVWYAMVARARGGGAAPARSRSRRAQSTPWASPPTSLGGTGAWSFRSCCHL